MATRVYTVEEIELQDGTEATLRPLPVKTLRVFMEFMDEFGKTENENDGLDVLLNASALCLSKEHPKYYDKDNRTRTDDYEEVIDVPTIYKILEICGGVKLNDPNLLAAAIQAAGGTTSI